jgi:hypothetical protein
MNITRRNFLTRFGKGTVASASLFVAHATVAAACQRVNGAGSSQLGPFEPVKAGDDPVYLTTDLGFDETMVFCKVTTNFAAFKFPTAQMGVIEFGAHEFFMEMRSVSIDSLRVEEGANGPQALFSGIMRSETRVFSGDRMKIFIEDHVSFGCRTRMGEATGSAQASKNYFSMTARYNPVKEHAAIFGEQVTFAGDLAQGNIIIIP